MIATLVVFMLTVPIALGRATLDAAFISASAQHDPIAFIIGIFLTMAVCSVVKILSVDWLSTVNVLRTLPIDTIKQGKSHSTHENDTFTLT